MRFVTSIRTLDTSVKNQVVDSHRPDHRVSAFFVLATSAYASEAAGADRGHDVGPARSSRPDITNHTRSKEFCQVVALLADKCPMLLSLIIFLDYAIEIINFISL